MSHKTLAAIDIGSNGARLLIKRFFTPEADTASHSLRPYSQKLLFLRVPLRLGEDVFSEGKISKRRTRMMMQMMRAYKEMMGFHEVDYYRACATSAMRDAENGKKMMRRIAEEVGIELEIIKGSEEAQLLRNNLLEQECCHNGQFVFVDVGGGSTELSLISNGTVLDSCSFNIGTLRSLSPSEKLERHQAMHQMLSNFAAQHREITILGSGGNINRLHKIATKGKTPLSTTQLQSLRNELAALSLEERKARYQLKDDRADVIVPAADIFLFVAQALNCSTILVPNISLADSILNGLWSEMKA